MKSRLGAYFAVIGIGIATGGAEGGDPMLLWGVIEVVSGLMLVVGPLVASRRPRIGTGLVVEGTLTIAVTHVWLIAINVPIAIALIVAAVVRSRMLSGRAATAPA